MAPSFATIPPDCALNQTEPLPRKGSDGQRGPGIVQLDGPLEAPDDERRDHAFPAHRVVPIANAEAPQIVARLVGKVENPGDPVPVDVGADELAAPA